MRPRIARRIHRALAALVTALLAVVGAGACDEAASTDGVGQIFTGQALSKFRFEARTLSAASTDPMPLKETFGDQTGWFERSPAGYEAPGLLDDTQRSAPAAVSWDHDRRADVFWLGTSGTIRHTWSDDGGDTWGADDIGVPSGYRAVGTPAAVSGAYGYLDVIVLARNLSTLQFGVFHKRWTGAWGPWVFVASAPPTMPTSGAMGITAAAWGPGRIDVWVRMAPDRFRHSATSDSGSTWLHDELALPEIAVGLPQAVSWGGNRLDLFYIRSVMGASGVDSVVKQWAWDGADLGFFDLGRPAPCDGRTLQLRGADTTRSGPSFNPLVTIAVACPLTTSPPPESKVYTRQWLPSSWDVWREGIVPRGGANEPAGHHGQAAGAILTWNRVQRLPTISRSVKVCQLTGATDRGRPGRPTGVALGGGTFGANATDIGYAFRDPFRDRLVFPFGDTHQFPTDRCEPDVCGVMGEPLPAGFEAPHDRWVSRTEWDQFVFDNGDGQEHMATAPLGGFDPDACIPLRVRTERRAWTFGHPISIASRTVDPATRLGGPKVAARAQDKWVLAMGTRVLVVTRDGRVFNHDVGHGQVGIPFLLGQVPSYANDKVFVVLGQHILAVRGNGYVDAYPVVGNSIHAGRRLGPMPGQHQPLVAMTWDARQIVANPMTNQLLVTTVEGKLYFHRIDLVQYRIEVPHQLGTPGMLEGRLVVIGDASGGRLLNITSSGLVWFYVLTSTSVGPAQLGAGSRIASRPEDGWIVAMGNHVLVVTGQDLFHPSRLNGRPVGRKEGIFSGFTDGATTYAFFTRRMWEPGCPEGQLEGCGHDEAGRAKTVLAFSTDGSNDFREVAAFSRRMFLFPAPEVVSSVPAAWGLPEMAGAPAVVVIGAGRAQLPDPAPHWHRSFPRLAISSLSTLRERRSEVHVHDVNPSASVVSQQTELGIPPYGVAAHPQDRWVVGRNGQILVIDEAGVVHVHQVNAATVSGQTALAGPPVGTDPRDRWVLAKGQDKLVILREDGLVYMQPVGSSVGSGYQLGPAAGLLPAVGNHPEDRWALVVGNSILVIKRDGRVVKYDIWNDTSIYPPQEIATDAFRGLHNDRNIEQVVVVGSYIYSITNKGTVRASAVGLDGAGWVTQIGSAVAQSGSRVAWNPNDRWVIPVGVPDSQGGAGGRLAVIPYVPRKWKYYAGPSADGTPAWKDSEEEAVPLPPFGQGDYHRCLGYFSIRYVASRSKWIMLYTCGGAALGPGERRGVYVRGAPTPFGPWSAPQLIWWPEAAQGIGHCEFMFSRHPCSGGANPFEGSQRFGNDDDPKTAPGGLAWGAEYAPLLLPSEYFKPASSGTDVTFYYAMSTWNPYQVVLMRSTGTLP